MIHMPFPRRASARAAAAGALLLLLPLAASSATATAATPVGTKTAEVAAGQAPSTSFSYSSAPGDSIGQGQSGTFDQSTIQIGGNTASIGLRITTPGAPTTWVSVTPGAGDTLHPGRYADAESASYPTGRAPGVNVSLGGRECSDVYGSFTVNQLAFNPNGTLAMADVSLVQRCGSATAPALRGTIHYHRLPLSYHLASDAGDPIGDGATKTYLGATSVFDLSGDATGLRLQVSGRRDTWTAGILPPTGQQLAAGRYQTSKTGDSVLAGLDVTGQDPGAAERGCDSSTGTLTIKTVTFAADGAVSNLNASFVQHCNGGTAALRGTIRYLA